MTALARSAVVVAGNPQCCCGDGSRQPQGMATARRNPRGHRTATAAHDAVALMPDVEAGPPPLFSGEMGAILRRAGPLAAATVEQAMVRRIGLALEEYHPPRRALASHLAHPAAMGDRGGLRRRAEVTPSTAPAARSRRLEGRDRGLPVVVAPREQLPDLEVQLRVSTAAQ